jgi:uncharacterized membrane protein
MCWKDLATITATFLILDGIYFTVNSKFLSDSIKAVQKMPIRIKYSGVVLTYAFMVAILYYFIIRPNRSAMDAFYLGVGVYGVYELTNYATLTNWPIMLVIIDTLWGGILFASAACMVKYVVNKKKTKN